MTIHRCTQMLDLVALEHIFSLTSSIDPRDRKMAGSQIGLISSFIMGWPSATSVYSSGESATSILALLG